MLSASRYSGKLKWVIVAGSLSTVSEARGSFSIPVEVSKIASRCASVWAFFDHTQVREFLKGLLDLLEFPSRPLRVQGMSRTFAKPSACVFTLFARRGYDATIIMPDDVAKEKVAALEALGATVERVRPASIVDKKQNLARQRATKFGRADTINESDILNRPHLIPSTSSSVVVSTTSLHVDFDTNDPDEEEDYLMKPRGTGGTLAGIGQYIKSLNENVVVALADPEGSGLYNKVKHGVMFDRKESEGTKRRHQVDTVVEGILTNNIDLALPIIDDAFRISDAEAVSMSRYLVQHDGLFLGSSSACNLVACVKLVRRMGWAEGQTLVTIL
ncbi:hypothetical protein DXG01_004926 [Tephrocybe rancida]|nr:hypothetical protein DXG01_004926 [Tephrocybe rancida]